MGHGRILWAALLACLLLGGCAKTQQDTVIASGTTGETQETSPSLAVTEAPSEETVPEEIPTEETTVPPETPPEETAPEEHSYDDQIALILQNYDLWKVQEERDWWGYAVTDLDRDGMLEIVSSETHGTGLITSTRVWKVNDSCTGLDLLAQPLEGALTAVLTSENLPCYYDPDSDFYYYIETETTRDGAARYLESVSALVLRYGRLERLLLGRKETVYESAGSPRVTCTDGMGAVITEEEYEALPQSSFPGLTASNVHIKWIGTPAVPVTLEQLQASWKGF